MLCNCNIIPLVKLIDSAVIVIVSVIDATELKIEKRERIKAERLIQLQKTKSMIEMADLDGYAFNFIRRVMNGI